MDEGTFGDVGLENTGDVVIDVSPDVLDVVEATGELPDIAQTADLLGDDTVDPLDTMQQDGTAPIDPVVHTPQTIERGGGAAFPEGEPGRGGLNVPPDWIGGGPERGG